ncbi:glucose sorbosone dehydrogenase [Candidatus Bathyarchaeota archaeon RBG_16_48_13]|nr:MAG: glucose sorbosone dehydrogenase [Candidatus Bathyarchaeota archaeon RBG_16_48_13]
MGLKGKILFTMIAASVLAVTLIFYFLYVAVPPGQVQGKYGIQIAFSQLTFSNPVGICSAGDGSNSLFVVEQAGTIRVFQNAADAAASTVFLDITDRVLFSGEQGLLGLAFHPNFSSNGYFYVDYVEPNPTRTVIARYKTLAGNPNGADKASEFVILEIAQPFPNHKGGQLAFGPDGYLYIGLGDGGSGGDPLGNGQNRLTLLGKILRVDVNSPSSGRNYGIPADNPFVGNALGYREEIFAYGFRNPWRFSFDSATGKLWVGDVGQDQIEEIDVVEKGKNYGWNIMEGTLHYKGGNQTGLELPVYEYNHSLGYAIIGGYVYRGSALPQLRGAYVYGDYGSGRIWALAANGTNTLLVNSNLTISSFGIGENKELYGCAFDGKIYSLSAPAILGLLSSTPKAINGSACPGATLLQQTPHR